MIIIQNQEEKNFKKILSKNTIVKVRGWGQQSMVKDHTFALYNFGTLPDISLPKGAFLATQFCSVTI